MGGIDSPTGHYELYRVRIKNLLEEIDVDQFVHEVSLMPSDHKNLSLCNRVLDLFAIV